VRGSACECVRVRASACECVRVRASARECVRVRASACECARVRASAWDWGSHHLHPLPHPPGTWMLDIPHHKNTKRWSGVAINLSLPKEVADLMEHHIVWGHNALTMCVEDPAPTLFVNKATGNALKAQEAPKLWKTTVLKGTGVDFAPHMCRSIFVVGTKDMGMPIKSGMAMVMGSSQKTVWESIYDKHFNKREVGEAMEHMPSWRKTMLAAMKNKKPKV
jgi:hypothetical protein